MRKSQIIVTSIDVFWRNLGNFCKRQQTKIQNNLAKLMIMLRKNRKNSLKLVKVI